MELEIEGQEITTTVNVETFFEAILNTGIIFRSCQHIRISGESASRLKEFYCII